VSNIEDLTDQAYANGHAAGERDATDAQRYNGWANRETWAVALHINNDQGWQESVTELVRTTVRGIDQDPPTYITAGELTDAFYANRVGDAIRDNVEETLQGEYHDGTHGAWYSITEGQHGAREDIGSMWRVDWREIGAAFLSDLAEGDDVSSS